MAMPGVIGSVTVTTHCLAFSGLVGAWGLMTRPTEDPIYLHAHPTRSGGIWA